MKFPASNQYLAHLSSIGHAKELLTSEGYNVIAAARTGCVRARIGFDRDDFAKNGDAVLEAFALKLARALITEGLVTITVSKAEAHSRGVLSGELLVIRPE